MMGFGKQFEPTIESIEAAEEYVRQILADAQVSKKVSAKVNMAMDEMYTNIASYSGATEAYVNCTVGQQDITLVLADNGKEYNPLLKDDPDIDAPIEEREIGGLGIFMTKSFMDSMEYEYRDGFNIVTLVKTIDE